jgi:hypothetical protein
MAKVRARLSINKQKLCIFHRKVFNLKQLNHVEGNEKYHVEVSNRFAALKEFDMEVKMNSAWEMIRKNIKISVEKSLVYYEEAQTIVQ